jgi:hypothetical protein
VESVAWASERKDTLSTFFGLLSLVAYVRYAEYVTAGFLASQEKEKRKGERAKAGANSPWSGCRKNPVLGY